MQRPTVRLCAAAATALAGGLLFACGDAPRTEKPAATTVTAATDARPVGHLRMVRELADVHERTVAGSQWLGEGPLLRLRAQLAALPPQAPDGLRVELLMAVAESELRLANEREALDHLQEAYALLPHIEGQIPYARSRELIFRLGVAWLRYGETQNCALRHNAQSCILPIRGEGVHADQEGSRQAVRYFEEVLRTTPRDQPLHLKTAWLLNIAYMTLGEYPWGVPVDYRMELSTFGSEAEFPHFENVAPALGISSFNLSGGAVFDDLDGDNHLDLFTTTFDTQVAPRVFLNRGDATFRDVTATAGLEGLFGGLNIVQADYDNDGDLDLYLLRGAWFYTEGRHPNSLLRNDGGGRFTDVTFEAGLGESHYPTQTASWADYDNDGFIDLFVGNEEGGGLGEAADPTPDFAAPSQLFRNNGDGTFTDVATAAGVAVRTYVKGVIWGDYDNDRWPDLYISVLGAENFLFHNNGDGTFTDVARAANVAEPIQSFPIWFWDYDNDGNLDLYVSTYRGQIGLDLVAVSYLGLPIPFELPRLYRGDGKGSFTDVSRQAGLTRLHLTMGCNFGDLDGDGWLDFYLGTGYPDYEGIMPNVVYHNRGGSRFVDVSLAAGLAHLQKGHAITFADFDHDGDQDVFEQMGGAFPGDKFGDALFLNPGFGYRWLTLKLEGTRSNRAALGARIRVDFEEEGRIRSVHRRVTSGASFGGNPLRQTVGLGRATRIEKVEIYWPTSDLTQTFDDVELDRFYRVVEGSDRLEPLLGTEPAAAEPRLGG